MATPSISFRDRTPSPRQAWRQLPENRRRQVLRGAEVGVVAALFPFYTAFALLLAFIFALTWVPQHIDVPERVPYARLWSRPRVWVLPVAVLLLAVLYPRYYDRTANIGHGFGHLGTIGSVPFFGQFPSIDTAVVMLVYIMMAIGLNIVVGYAGLLDLGYVAFYAMGAYTAAWFASPQFAKHTFHFLAAGVPGNTIGWHLNVWLVLLLAGIFTAIIGVIIGLPTLRLRGDYLAIVTLGFGEIMPQVATNGDNFFGTGFNLTNGASGISPIDGPGFGHTVHNALPFLPSNFFDSGNSTELFFWTGIVLVLFTVFCSWRLRDSRLGRAWIAIREDEIAAAAMGIPLMRTKTWAYACGAFFGGIAGAFFATYKQATFSTDFSFNISVFILCMVILGGMGSIWGVIAGGAFLAYLNEAGLGNIGGWIHQNLGITIDVQQYSFLIYGIIILVIMLFRPEGLIPSSRRKAELHRGVADEPLYDVTV
ncbi:MAG: branched-chain amino acid ABC transporter permease [Gaiellaceae bacterium]